MVEPVIDRVDPSLSAFLCEADDAHAQRLLNTLIAEQAEPLVRRIIRHRFRAHPQIAEGDDLCHEVLLHLLRQLRSLRENPHKAVIGNFQSYVAVTAHNLCHAYWRQKHPERTRLKDAIRYLVNHHPDFALWAASENASVCGFNVWRGRRDFISRIKRHPKLDEKPRAFIHMQPTEASDIEHTELADMESVILN